MSLDIARPPTKPFLMIVNILLQPLFLDSSVRIFLSLPILLPQSITEHYGRTVILKHHRSRGQLVIFH